jgi:hypothetical protein
LSDPPISMLEADNLSGISKFDFQGYPKLLFDLVKFVELETEGKLKNLSICKIRNLLV